MSDYKKAKPQPEEEIKIPKKPIDGKLVYRNKTWLKKQMKHNDFYLMDYPSGASGPEVELDGSGIWPSSHQVPISFNTDDFEHKFEQATFDERFRCQDWCFDLSKPDKVRWTGESQEKFDNFVRMGRVLTLAKLNKNSA